MEVMTCKTCGKIFNYLQGPLICPSCKKKLEEKFGDVKEYVRANEGATMSQIAEANEVSIKQIKQWIREERLSFTDNSPIGIECENCGKMIRTGRFCDKCKSKLANNLKEMYVVPKQAGREGLKARDKERMRFLDRES